MKALFLLIALLALTIAGGLCVSAQTPAPASAATPDPGIKPTSVIGEVKVVDSAAKQMTVKTDAGTLVTVAVSDATSYLRLAPGETTKANATKIAFSDVGEGDRVLARGRVAADHKSVSASEVIVMTKADLAKKQEKERAEWRQRGILGVVSTVKPDTKEITITTRTGVGSQPVIIPVFEKLDMRRYAPDSIKFSDAQPSKLEEVKVGDQVRALGDKSADGTHFTAEKVVTGTFQTVAGTVTAVDAAAGEIKINNMQTKQPLTIVIKADSVLRKFPAEMAAMMGGRGPGAAGPGGASGTTGQPAPAGNKPQQGAGGAPGGGAGPGGGRPGGGNIQEMLDRLPTISTADVKVGDTIIVSSTKGADPSRLTAITLVSGADTLLAMLAPRPAPGAGQTAPNPAAGLGSGISFGIGLP